MDNVQANYNSRTHYSSTYSTWRGDLLIAFRDGNLTKKDMIVVENNMVVKKMQLFVLG